MTRKLLFFIMMMLGSQTVQAHMGGHGPVDEQQALSIAGEVASQFVDFDPGLDFGKLDKSWKAVAGSDLTMHKKGNGYYIVSLHNKAENRTLYILMSIEGEVFDANFTGVFPGLDTTTP